MIFHFSQPLSSFNVTVAKNVHLRRKIRARHPLRERAAAVELDLRCCSSRQFGHVFMAQLFPLPPSLPLSVPRPTSPTVKFGGREERRRDLLDCGTERRRREGGREMVGRESARQPVSQSLTTLTRTEEPQRKKGREGRKDGRRRKLFREVGREGGKGQ